MPSQRKGSAAAESGGGRLSFSEAVEAPAVEIDATFGRLMGLVDRQKVDCLLRCSSKDELKRFNR